jgi:hypothetical protein
VKLLVDAFIAAYVIGVWCWWLPPRGIARTHLGPVLSVLRWAGFEQVWSMFTPDPPNASHELQAIIRLRSGRIVVWRPAPTGLSAWAAFVRFRYREYASTILSDAAAPCRPALIDYLLRKYRFDGDPPVEVMLTCLRTPVAAPGQHEAAEVPETLLVHHRAADSRT